MPAERAGYTVTMFIVDVSSSMSKTRPVDMPDRSVRKVSNLQWGLQYIKLKIQEMIYNGRKTDQCGVILVGSEDTDNMINKQNGGYEQVSEYIPIAQPNPATLAKLDELEPTNTEGDALDALIVAIQTQNNYLAKKKWTRKIVLLTDAETALEMETPAQPGGLGSDWLDTAAKMNEFNVEFTLVGIDFDDLDFPFEEEDKSDTKKENEDRYKQLVEQLDNGLIGTCAYALQEISRPDVKMTKSTLSGTVLRLGDLSSNPDMAFEIMIKTSKCTGIARPKSWKKFAIRPEGRRHGEVIGPDKPEDIAMEVDNPKPQITAQLRQHRGYMLYDEWKEIQDADSEDEVAVAQKIKDKRDSGQEIMQDDLIRGFSYGTTYVPCPDGQFMRLDTNKGIEMCGFFRRDNFRRDYSMGEIQYVWADPSSPKQQVALSSLVQAMAADDLIAIARWVTKDGSDVKMGVLAPTQFEKVDCFLWSQVPFADDVRKYTFPSWTKLVSKKGEVLEEHPYLPNEKQMSAMGNFVDAMDLSDAGEKDEEGNRLPWFDTRESYNPALHRTKQAMFHCAVVNSLDDDPLPPPHPSLLQYWDPPRRVLKRARDAIEDCMTEFDVHEVPKKAPRTRKEDHVHAKDEDDEPLLLDSQPSPNASQSQSQRTPTKKAPAAIETDDASDTEDEEEEPLLLGPASGAVNNEKRPQTPPGKPAAKLPTPEASPEPAHHGRAPGRIIGTTDPLKDFLANLEEGDLVTKAVQDLAVVIREIVVKPFTARRSEELLECMRSLRDTCLQEDEIDAWNQFVRDLKDDCHGEPGNTQFWGEVSQQGRGLSLISESEAEKLGGQSDVSDTVADKFFHT